MKKFKITYDHADNYVFLYNSELYWYEAVCALSAMYGLPNEYIVNLCIEYALDNLRECDKRKLMGKVKDKCEKWDSFLGGELEYIKRHLPTGKRTKNEQTSHFFNK